MWKEEFENQYTSMSYGEKWRPGMEITPSMIKAFIQSKFAELIEEIPDGILLTREPGTITGAMLKQQLRDKWL